MASAYKISSILSLRTILESTNKNEFINIQLLFLLSLLSTIIRALSMACINLAGVTGLTK